MDVTSSVVCVTTDVFLAEKETTATKVLLFFYNYFEFVDVNRLKSFPLINVIDKCKLFLFIIYSFIYIQYKVKVKSRRSLGWLFVNGGLVLKRVWDSHTRVIQNNRPNLF